MPLFVFLFCSSANYLFLLRLFSRLRLPKVSRGPLSDEGFSKMEESSELQGTGALLLLLPALPTPVNGQDDQDVPLLSALLQLKQLQQASAWHSPLPLVILVPGDQHHSTSATHNLEEGTRIR